MYSVIISKKKNHIFDEILAGATTQTFDGMVDFRRQQARRTVLVHVKSS